VASDSEERYLRQQYANFEIRKDRIVSGTNVVQEFCLTKVLVHSPTVLVSEAVWREDARNPRDASMVRLRLERAGNRLTMTEFSLYDVDEDDPWQVTFTRQ
jgi:hypothetical protein